jgi:Asparaginase
MTAFYFTGYGSALNTDGEVEMDAIIMEGQELKAGMYSWPALHNLCEYMDLSCLCG